MNARIATIGGMGYPFTETAAGMPHLTERFKAIGIDVGASVFKHNDRQAIRDWLWRFNGFRALIGDSLGAGAAALYAGDLDGEVDFVGGFQPSNYDPIGNGPAGHHEIPVSANIKVAHCIRDPRWIDTFGLGQAYYVVRNTKTVLTLTENYGAHPDDWGYSQDLMFNHVKQLLPVEKTA